MTIIPTTPCSNFSSAARQRQSPRRQQEQPRQQQLGLGSGVIISEDGYIVTNNHVIADAERLEVTLNDNRNFPATVVGTDPTTDLALIKIDAPQLHVIPMGNSEDLRVGEWVLAVGNPFGFTSTVTSGHRQRQGPQHIYHHGYAVVGGHRVVYPDRCCRQPG